MKEEPNMQTAEAGEPMETGRAEVMQSELIYHLKEMQFGQSFSETLVYIEGLFYLLCLQCGRAHNKPQLEGEDGEAN